MIYTDSIDSYSYIVETTITPSIKGIDGGCIKMIKVWSKENNNILAYYDKKWIIAPDQISKNVLENIMQKFN